ncbi:hypothetical protein G6F63_015622 [Rhizopus arrhizus]|nr:hypothetical protein G6F63_015622 [Rhizopus arrhizus]
MDVLAASPAQPIYPANHRCNANGANHEGLRRSPINRTAPRSPPTPHSPAPSCAPHPPPGPHHRAGSPRPGSPRRTGSASAARARRTCASICCSSSTAGSWRG